MGGVVKGLDKVMQSMDLEKVLYTTGTVTSYVTPHIHLTHPAHDTETETCAHTPRAHVAVDRSDNGEIRGPV